MKTIRRTAPIFIPITAAGLIPAALLLLPQGPRLPVSAAVRLALACPLMVIGAWMVADAVNRVYLLQDTPLGDRPPERLVVDGWYGVIRNPMALGMTLLLVGEAVALSAAPVLIWAAVVLTVSRLTAVRVEEPSLLAVFGEEYEDYRRCTRRWLLVPFRRSRRR
ncbi:methyltransferase family protein [Streptomyces collinus]|uniref:methyltransferase family protein n=1 Tax=Streptomyces collinus TaxID=42684 RepID=UPI003819E4DC